MSLYSLRDSPSRSSILLTPPPPSLIGQLSPGPFYTLGLIPFYFGMKDM